MMSLNRNFWRRPLKPLLFPLALLLFCLLLDVIESRSSNSVHPRFTRETKTKNSKHIKFFLYPNSQHINDTQELHLEEPESILKSNFSVHQPLKILLHGFNGDCTDIPFPALSVQQYLLLKAEKNSSFNILCVDWGPLSRYNGVINFVPTYVLARIGYNHEVGKKLARMIVFLKDTKMIKSLSDVHVIGHSLGAQIAGITGFKVNEMTGERIGRISGLDPAGPLYREWPDLDEQLDPSDAEFVDVYHTSMRRTGLEGKYGHADFYPNGGVRQPSCLEPGNSTQPQQLLETLTESIFGGCSHNIVSNYWADSIRNTKTLACKAASYAAFSRKVDGSDVETRCKEDYAVFGENCSLRPRGKYFLNLDAKYTPNPAEGPFG